MGFTKHRWWFRVACVVLTAAAAPGIAGACSRTAGQAVVLRSDETDPDVFVWDSSERLAAFESGSWVTRAVFAHTKLVSTGAQAVVVACAPGLLHSAYGSPGTDAIEIRLRGGAFAGDVGWVTSGNAVPLPPAAQRRAPQKRRTAS